MYRITAVVRIREISRSLWIRGVLLLAVMVHFAPTRLQADELDFFEKRIRPLLAQNCYACHGPDLRERKSELRLDHISTLLEGGTRGPAIVRGRPQDSLLVQAIRYQESDLRMPPSGKLPDDKIADLVRWIEMGAPWPDEPIPGPEREAEVFDLEKRKAQHWAWSPIARPPLPRVSRPAWSAGVVDRFVQAQHEAHGLGAAPPADRPTLIRRLTFDLTGLPPTADEVRDFIGDHRPDAYQRLVDRLLASPGLGERWGRHWLDLVRYAETLGHEFDYPIFHAWRYRDYVVRALNADVPYDQFVKEHIAGDLLAAPRRLPGTGTNESVIGTAFYWLGQQTHAPVDVRQNQADLLDNQIDVLSKTFLGLTVACARCHDHKFDAISTKDFYALYGVLASSHYTQASIDPPGLIAEKKRRLVEIKEQMRRSLARAWTDDLARIADYLLAVHGVQQDSRTDGGAENPAARIDRVAGKKQLDPAQLTRWIHALGEKQSADPGHPMVAWTAAVRAGTSEPNATLTDVLETLADRLRDEEEQGSKNAEGDLMFADFGEEGTHRWSGDGDAFSTWACEPGDFVVQPADSDTPLPTFRRGWVHSGAVSRRLEGAIRSPSFTIDRDFIHIYASGQGSRINVVVDNFLLIRNPIYGGLKQLLKDDTPRWISINVAMWKGHRAFIELCDKTTPDPADPNGTGGYDPVGYLAAAKVLFSDRQQPPPMPAHPPALAVLDGGTVVSLDDLAMRYQEAVGDVVGKWQVGERLDTPSAQLLAWLIERRLLPTTASDLGQAAASAWREQVETYWQVETTIPRATTVPAMADGSGFDERVFIRGNYRNLGPPVPRRLLEALTGPDTPRIESGSGRLDIAEQMLDASNPLLARVYVNRLWHHLFGRGIVPTTDDFGVPGQPPSHPELLDWLADWFRSEGGWSTKRLVRQLVTSETYRMSSRPGDARWETADPTNRWYHRMSVRRLQGEAIRDAVLSVSGRLDRTMFGASIPVHLTPFMEGRGRPQNSGPLDGDGRRSIYLEVRRNFLSPFMLAFDKPIPHSTIGKRNVSSVPAQALILMNNPFVAEQSKAWAGKVLEPGAVSPAERIREMYVVVYGREPASEEIDQAMDFCQSQSEIYGHTSGEWSERAEVWIDLCHALLCAKEFLFVP